MIKKNSSTENSIITILNSLLKYKNIQDTSDILIC